MPKSDSLLTDYVKKKLKLKVEESALLHFISLHKHFFNAKNELWVEKASIYLYSIVFSICNNKEPDLFFELIERQLQRKELDELKQIFSSLKLATDRLEKKWQKKTIKNNAADVEASFQISILVKIIENKLEIMSINFIESIIENSLQADLVQSIKNDLHIKSSETTANQSFKYLQKKFT